MSLSNEQKKHYRNIGHNLKPVVTIAGKGLSETVINEIERALDDHELIKVKFVIEDRDMRAQAIDETCKQTGALEIQKIGKVALLFRAAKKRNAKLSNIS